MHPPIFFPSSKPPRGGRRILNIGSKPPEDSPNPPQGKPPFSSIAEDYVVFSKTINHYWTDCVVFQVAFSKWKFCSKLPPMDSASPPPLATPAPGASKPKTPSRRAEKPKRPGEAHRLPGVPGEGQRWRLAVPLGVDPFSVRPAEDHG